MEVLSRTVLIIIAHLEEKHKRAVIDWIESHRPVNTKNVYKTYGDQYGEFAARTKMNPRSDTTLASFMLASHNRGLKRSTTVTAIPAAVGHMFRYEDRNVQAGSVLVKQMKKAIVEDSEPSAQKRPITVQQLAMLGCKAETNFTGVRNFYMMLLMTLGMMRGSEAVNLESSQVELQNLRGKQHLMILVAQSKTDRIRKGHTILLAAAENLIICPVAWYKIYSQWRNPNEATFFHSAPEKGSGKLSPDTARHIVKKAIAGIGEDPTTYGAHSCRRGGVTAAVAAEVDMLLIARHGNWKSTAVYLYVDHAVEAKLSVSARIAASLGGPMSQH